MPRAYNKKSKTPPVLDMAKVMAAVAPKVAMDRVKAAASGASTFRPVAKPLHHSRPAVDTAIRKPLTALHKSYSGFGRRQFFQD